MDVLLVYGTTEGQTKKIAEWTAARVRERGHNIELHDSAELMSDLDLKTFQAFILAGSVHHQRHQDSITDFATAHQNLLNARPSAFISVSLSAVVEGERAEAQRYVDDFVSVTGWHPRMTLLLGGALRFTEYDYFQEQVVKLIVLKGGSARDQSNREFTDWDALGGFVDAFLEAAA